MHLRPGAHLTPELTLERPLGRGGMGRLWIARHATLGKVAVKLTAGADPDADPATLARFAREATLATQIDNPHVVKTHFHGTTDEGDPFLVMELLSGETLATWVHRKGRLSLATVRKLVSEVGEALGEAHRLGVVHRDIKPDNVFIVLGEDGPIAKVLDFGIAKQITVPKVSEVTEAGTIVGTPEYMSPEQLLTPRSADFRADLWALGVVAYHALTGVLPFTGETLPSISVAICSGDFMPPSRRVESLPEAVDAWFAKVFAPAPEDRHPDLATMVQSFTQIDDDTLEAPDDWSEAPPESGPRWSTGAWAQDELDPEPEAARRDSGFDFGFPAAEADQSGRRRAVSDDHAERLVSPTLAGSAANVLEPSNPRRHGFIWLSVAGLLLLAIWLLSRVDLSGSASPASPSSPQASSSSEPRASASASASAAASPAR
ncbi:MAG: serine/threonine-protein kinase [Polyangiaceae bacterium]